MRGPFGLDDAMTLPTFDLIAAAAAEIATETIRTPVLSLRSDRWRGILPDAASITVKLELFQQAGSFTARGALLVPASYTHPPLPPSQPATLSRVR